MEKLMHYVWANRLFPQNNLTTVDGKRLQVINPGIINNGAGPDFFNASVIIDNQTWVGNVEIHLRASDWHRHKHTDDPAYQTVILHVVEADDQPIYRPNGEVIPQFVMKCRPDLNASFRALADFSVDTLPCSAAIKDIPSIYMTDWVTALGYERLHEKVERIESLVASNSGDWNEAAYITIARALGFGTNSQPFERLARATPLRIMRRHADNPLIVEAILLGQAGLLDAALRMEGYSPRLATEYQFFAAKFGLMPPADMGWKFSRMRPQNFPIRRISYLGALICSCRDFTSRLLGIERLADAYDMLADVARNGTGNHTGALSKSSLDILCINAVIPLAYAYANYNGNYTRAREIAELLHEIKPESNRITSMFASAGINISSAFVSQAMVQLRREYCEKRKCLYCRIGHRHLSACSLRM
ncbi:MAG: DUF2851 family protein [Barnesiella sp.]|nr:DUF2851 family protein [Barnesiella sp.]